jgi:hypothetical protein
MNPIRLLASLCAVLLLASMLPARAATFTVGGDFQCTHSTIQAALDAAGQSPGLDTIRIANNQSYTAQALVRGIGTGAGGTGLEIIGGFSDCSDTSASGNTVISGQGGAEASVLTVNSGETVLRNLSFIRGDASMVDGRGGGIRFSGTRAGDRLELFDVIVSQNRAAFGGGLQVAGGTVVIGAGTQFVLNTAQFSGGGVHIRGSSATNVATSVEMVGLDNLVINNEALGVDPASGQFSGGFGGGVYVEAPAVATLRFGATGGLGSNQARLGRRRRHLGRRQFARHHQQQRRRTVPVELPL